MAPAKDNSSDDAGDGPLAMLKAALKRTTGTIDFSELAKDMGVSNAEAMRKRFRRFFEKDDDPLIVKGNSIGADNVAAPTPRTPGTPKTKSTPAKTTQPKDDNKASPTPVKAKIGTKRKAAEPSTESPDVTDAIQASEADGPASPTTPVAGNDDGTSSPKKKAKTSQASSTPKTPRASKSPAQAKLAKKSTKEEDDDDTGVGTKVVETTGKVRVGSPEIQAKTDSAIKQVEKASGAAIGEPEKQVKRDAVEKNVKSAAED